MKPYTGYIYRCPYNNISHIGCTTEVKKRQEDHKSNSTNQFGRAIKQYQYNNLKFEILENVKFSEMQELYDIEDIYIIKDGSINNWFNTRRNYKGEL